MPRPAPFIFVEYPRNVIYDRRTGLRCANDSPVGGAAREVCVYVLGLDVDGGSFVLNMARCQVGYRAFGYEA